MDVGVGGWTIRQYGEVTLRVRFGVTDDGRLEPNALFVEAPRLNAEVARGLPLANMEMWANGGDVRRELLASIDSAGHAVDRATLKWVSVLDPDHADLTEISSDLPAGTLRLVLPAGRAKKPDEFYNQVAGLYEALTSSGNRYPATAIAAANDVPATTVRRWVKEARARGLLGPGRQGKAG